MSHAEARMTKEIQKSNDEELDLIRHSAFVILLSLALRHYSFVHA